MSTPIGEKIRNVRKSLGMGRQEFVDKTGIPKGTLIGAEQGLREPKAGILIAIATAWPEYAAYLLSDEVNIKQKYPDVKVFDKEEALKELADAIQGIKTSHDHGVAIGLSGAFYMCGLFNKEEWKAIQKQIPKEP